MSDKPATATYDEVLALEAAVAKIGLAVRVDAYLCRLSLVREARAICASGKLGRFARLRSSICRDG